MQIIRNLEEFCPEGPIVLTQGTFDGVHLGHQKILSQLVTRAQQINGKSVMLTFYPHPRLVLYPEDNDLKLITSIEEKARLLESFGLDYLVILPFTKELSRLTAFGFIRDVLVNKLHISTIIIGYDHRFGKNREGSFADIEKYTEEFEYEVEQIPEQDINDCIVSSSLIRKALLSGDLEAANDFLGRPFSIRGIVVSGNRLGKGLGYPTANVGELHKFKLIPKIGVYAVIVIVAGVKYFGMLNVGTKPTFKLNNLTVETHIFDFSEDIYGQEIEILFVKRWRDEHKFESQEALVRQLDNDSTEINAFFNK
ncbi:MAG: riboflavin kinase/FMN adenylyltransferase [Bacteroidia bacterium]|jgi:riboflavin kinase/FMN adenylyltransferase